jgi:hypothetical protein
MANRAYASVWSRNFSEETLIEQWKALLETVPFSDERPGFTELVIRAVDATEAPVFEQDLRSGEYGADVLADLAREHAHGDCSYETRALWDLWTWDESSSRWMRKPQPLSIVAYGSDFDEGVWKEQGHFLIHAGFEHFFTGHAKLLGFRRGQTEAERGPEEANFVAVMSQRENLQMYQEKTQENIRKLYDWMRRIEAALPVERYQLWSEGEDNFEARMEEILATR